MARVLVAEARSSYPSGKSAAIHVKSEHGVEKGVISEIEKSVSFYADQHLEVVPDYKEFRHLVERLDFEKMQEEFSITEVGPFKQAEIYILIDVLDIIPDGSILKVVMRAFWLSGSQVGANVRGLKAVGYLKNTSKTEGPISEKLPFQVNYVYRPGGIGKPRPITNASVLQSGDLYKIIFTPERDCYVYIFQVDTSRQIFQLFPMQEFRGVEVHNYNPVKGGMIYTLPAPDKSFKLDSQIGRERIYFIAYKERNEKVEALFEHLTVAMRRMDVTNVENAYTKLNKYFKKRGVDLIVTDRKMKVNWEESSDVFSIFSRKLENLCEDCVHTVEFIHR
jgi:hypothetical protein